MIYLIETAYYNEETKTPLKLLKIGYTNDSRWNIRYQTYKHHNPCCKVLFKVPNVTVEYERCLHSYFSALRFSDYGREWYYWDKKIIDFFKQNKTFDDIINTLTVAEIDIHSLGKYRVGEIMEIANKVTKYLQENKDLKIESVLSIFTEMVSGLRGLGDQSELKIWEFIREKFDIRKEDVFLFWESKEKEFNQLENKTIDQVNSFLSQFDSFRTYTEKMRFLCDESLDEEVLNLILFRLPVDFTARYLILGSKRIKALGCRRCNVISESDTVATINSKEFTETIYNSFKPGDKLSNKQIKEMLRSIYDKLGIPKTPKATDLEEYFEVKAGKLYNKEEGKWVNGLELLSHKKKII